MHGRTNHRISYSVRLKGVFMSATHARICIYNSDPDAMASLLTATFAHQLAVEPLGFETLENLLIHLKSPTTTEDIVVLAPADAGELTTFLAYKRLQDRRLVLILPDAEETTLSQAHLLGPRYLCFADSIGGLSGTSGTDLAAVLNKMAANPPINPTWEGALG
jgi:hypothetical protein